MATQQGQASKLLQQQRQRHLGLRRRILAELHQEGVKAAMPTLKAYVHLMLDYHHHQQQLLLVPHHLDRQGSAIWAPCLRTLLGPWTPAAAVLLRIPLAAAAPAGTRSLPF
jgi:hypothetical protein